MSASVKSRRRRVLIRLARLAALVIVMKWLVAWLEPRLVFFPYPGETETPRTLGLGYRDLAIRTADGETIAAWWIPHAAARADVVYFHGNGGNLSLWLPILAGVHGRGMNVLAFDYRGYGRSTGSPTEQGIYRDAEAVIRELARLRREGGARAADGRPRPVIYWGRSLGGAAAAHATTVTRPDGLILESTFPDKGSVIRYNVVLRLLNVFASYTFDTAEMLRGFDRPTLVIHGDADSVIPYAAGRSLFEGLTGPKRFVTLPGADHNDAQLPSAREYWQAVDDLVAQATAGP
jgi:hypothetical protein